MLLCFYAFIIHDTVYFTSSHHGSVSRTVSRLNPLLYKFLSRTRFKSCPTEENPLRLQSYMISNLSPNLIANC